MKAIICLLVLLGVFNNACAGNIVWNNSKDFLDIADQIQVFEETDRPLTIQQISSPFYEKKFSLSDQSVLHFGLTSSVYWLRFDLENNSGNTLWLQLEHAFIPEAELFYRSSAGDWQFYKSGYKIPLKDKLIKDHNQVFPLLHGKHQYYIRIVPYMHPIPVRIWNSNRYQITSINQKLVYGMYLGVLLFAIAIHLFLFFTLRFSYYLTYCILILSYINASVGVLEGYLVYFLPGIDLMYTYKVVPVINMPVLLIYCLSFLEIKKLSPKLYRNTNIISGFLIVYLVALHYLPTMPVLLINYVFALFTFLWACYIGIEAGRKGNKLGYYYTFTYAIWFALLFAEESNIQFGTPPHLFDLTYVSIATLVETFLLALLLAKRFQWNKQEDDRKKFELEKDIYQIQQKFDKEILQTQLEIQEQTFNNISQEIHDNIGQKLGVVNIYLYAIKTGSDGNNQKISESISLISSVLKDLRDIAKSLNSDYVKSIGLTRAIRQQVEILQKTGAYNIQYLADNEIKIEDVNKELLVFRIVQELLNNIIKHAEATVIRIIIQYSSTHLSIEVSDNGRGFNFTEVTYSNLAGGLGLNNMKNRLDLIQGIFFIDSKPFNGTIISITIPI